MGTKCNINHLLICVLHLIWFTSVIGEITYDSSKSSITSKDEAYRRAIETEYNVREDRLKHGYDPGRASAPSPPHLNTHQPYPHPFYEPYWKYQHGYLTGIDENSRNINVQHRTLINDDVDKYKNGNTKTFEKGPYREYVHGDTQERTVNAPGFRKKKELHDPNVFKDMRKPILLYNKHIMENKNMQPNIDSNIHPEKTYARDTDGCKFMESMNMREYMGGYFMDMICQMYKQWGEGMKSIPTWQPTHEQKRWFNSLGSQPPRNIRLKRQAGYQRKPRALRKEYRVLSDEERHRLHRAINIMKHTFMDGLSLYDVIVQNHNANLSPGAHFGPAFLGFHREYLLRFENALKEIDSSVSIPYWDSNLDYVLGDDLARYSILWTPSFLGNGKGDVKDGPFSYWRLPFASRTSQSGLLHRNLTIAPPFARTMPSLMSDEAILTILNAPDLRNISWFVNPIFESHHGAVHNWVGGVMADIPISPSDPVFFMHHAFLDCLWEQMRYLQKHRNPSFDPKYDYPNDSRALGVGMEQPDGSILEDPESSYHHPTNPLHPFAPLRNIDGLSNVYFDEFYSCQPSPVCSPNKPHCGSRYLFCDKNTFRCVPKLLLDLQCSEYSESDPCMEGVCCNGICKEQCEVQSPTRHIPDTEHIPSEPNERESSHGPTQPTAGHTSFEPHTTHVQNTRNRPATEHTSSEHPHVRNVQNAPNFPPLGHTSTEPHERDLRGSQHRPLFEQRTYESNIRNLPPTFSRTPLRPGERESSSRNIPLQKGSRFELDENRHLLHKNTRNSQSLTDRGFLLNHQNRFHSVDASGRDKPGYHHGDQPSISSEISKEFQDLVDIVHSDNEAPFRGDRHIF